MAKREYKPRKTLKAPIYSLADQWARMYGELMTCATAARMLGVSRYTIYRHRDAGHFVTSGGRLITRTVAAYYEKQESAG